MDQLADSAQNIQVARQNSFDLALGKSESHLTSSVEFLEQRPSTQLPGTPLTNKRPSKAPRTSDPLNSHRSFAEFALQRYNTRVTLSRDSCSTPERSFAYDPFKLPETPLIHQPRSVFFLTVSNSEPAPPLKAWRGYGGNIYFEPVNLKKAPLSNRHHKGDPYQLPMSLPSVTENRKSSLADTLINYYSSHKKYSYKCPFSVPAVHYDNEMIEKFESIPRNSKKPSAYEERKWMKGLQSIGSLKVAGPTEKRLRPVGSAAIDFRKSGDALGRITSGKSKLSATMGANLQNQLVLKNSIRSSTVH